MTIPYNNLLMAIWAERRYQDSKWGDIESQCDRDIGLWCDTLKEEVEEASDSDFAGNNEDALLELVQVAAVAMAALEQLAPPNLEELVKKHRGMACG
jgi:hypothetical protein